MTLSAHLQTIILHWVKCCKKEMLLDALPILLGVPKDEKHGMRYRQVRQLWWWWWGGGSIG